jgi:hypothetical protein
MIMAKPNLPATSLPPRQRIGPSSSLLHKSFARSAGMVAFATVALSCVCSSPARAADAAVI